MPMYLAKISLCGEYNQNARAETRALIFCCIYLVFNPAEERVMIRSAISALGFCIPSFSQRRITPTLPRAI